jgi:phosphoribosylformylglycinamidine synthase
VHTLLLCHHTRLYLACAHCGQHSLQIKLGDPTMSVLEIWGAEYQENDCLLLKKEDCAAFEAICARERCSMQARAAVCSSLSPCQADMRSRPGRGTSPWERHILVIGFQVLGEIDGSGRITLVDPTAPPDAPTPVDLDLEKVTHHRIFGRCI